MSVGRKGIPQWRITDFQSSVPPVCPCPDPVSIPATDRPHGPPPSPPTLRPVGRSRTTTLSHMKGSYRFTHSYRNPLGSSHCGDPTSFDSPPRQGSTTRQETHRLLLQTPASGKTRTSSEGDPKGRERGRHNEKSLTRTLPSHVRPQGRGRQRTRPRRFGHVWGRGSVYVFLGLRWGVSPDETEDRTPKRHG